MCSLGVLIERRVRKAIPDKVEALGGAYLVIIAVIKLLGTPGDGNESTARCGRLKFPHEPGLWA
jgi:hypothetical protein